MDQTRIAPAAFIEAPTRRRRRRRGIGRRAVIGAALMVTVAELAARRDQWSQYSRINDYRTRAEARPDEGKLNAPAFDNDDDYLLPDMSLAPSHFSGVEEK